MIEPEDMPFIVTRLGKKLSLILDQVFVLRIHLYFI